MNFFGEKFPLELVLVRHGESEANLARKIIKEDKEKEKPIYSSKFKDKHSSQYRLTATGRAQARATGQWLKTNITNEKKFEHFFVSEYARAIETASCMDLDGEWRVDFTIRELDKGQMDNISPSDKKNLFSNEGKLKERDTFYYAPPSGESFARVCARVDAFIEKLRRQCMGDRVLVVCHGELMLAFRMRLEKKLVHDFHNTIEKYKIPNGGIIHYYRGYYDEFYTKMRIVDPSKPDSNKSAWQSLEPTKQLKTNAQLMTFAESSELIIDNETGTKYHGNDNHHFWVYKWDQPVKAKWDTHDLALCGNYQYLGRDKNDNHEFVCQGHPKVKILK